MHLHAHSDLEVFTDITALMPKQVPSLPAEDLMVQPKQKTVGVEQELTSKHMAHLLKKSIFKHRKVSEIQATLGHIETQSHSNVWSKHNLLFKGTMLAGNFTQDLVERCQGKIVHILVSKGTKWSIAPEAFNWGRFGKLMSDQLTGKNRLETGYLEILQKKYPENFRPKQPPA